jgi:hypothetical protein
MAIAKVNQLTTLEVTTSKAWMIALFMLPSPAKGIPTSLGH